LIKNVGGISEYIVFLDECGDHTLELIDYGYSTVLSLSAGEFL